MASAEEAALGPSKADAVTPAPAGRAAGGLRRRVVSATLWSVLRMGASRTIALASNLILTRLLFPEAFGLMGVVNVWLMGMALLSDMGLGPSIIQNEKGDDLRFLNTAWVLQILRGLIIWAAAALAAWPLSVLYEQPELWGLITVAGLATALQGFASTAPYTLRRHLRPKKLAAMELAAQLISVLTMIASALLLGATVWVLVLGPVAAALTRVVWSHFLLGEYRNRFQWDPESARSIYHFGKWVFVSSTLYFLGTQLDRLMLPVFIPFDVFGLYAIATMLSALPRSAVSFLSSEVIFPAMSELSQLPRQELRAKILPTRGKLLALMAVGAGMLAGSGDVIVRVLYDPRYHDAGWMLIVLSIGLWPAVVITTIAPALLALGKPRYFAYASAVRAVTLGAGVPLGYVLGGLPGVILAVALTNLAQYAASAYGLWRNQLWLVRQDLRATALWLVVIAAVVGLREILPWPLLDWNFPA